MIIFQKFIYRADMRANPQVFYLWGDNERRVGFGGQAKEMRGEVNGIGIRTKRSPGTEPSAYWNDDDYDRQCKLVDEDFDIALHHIIHGRTIIVPLDGIGTGMARLHENAPRTLQYIKDWIERLKVS